MFLYFLREFVAAPIFFCNSHALLGESRGYCTKTKQEWPDSGSTLETFFGNSYEINASQDFFLYCKNFGVDGILRLKITQKNKPQKINITLAHQNRTIAIASDFRVGGAKSPEIPQQELVLGSEIAVRNRRSLATFHRTLKSQCIIAFSCLGNRAISGVRDGHRNRKSQKSLRFRRAKNITFKVIFRLKRFSGVEKCHKSK